MKSFKSQPARALLRDNEAYDGVAGRIVGTGYSTRTKPQTLIFDDTQTDSGVAQTRSFPTLQITASSSPGILANIAVDPGSIYLPVQRISSPQVYKDSAGTRKAPFSKNEVILGFSTSSWTKTQIEIDITPKRTKDLFRLDSSNAPSVGLSSTGFCYFNFSNKVWEDIGYYDTATRATGRDSTIIFIDPAITTQPIVDRDVQGAADRVCMQFALSPSVAYSASLDLEGAKAIGYRHIGLPTAMFSAPAAPRYHATASQCLRLSDYIEEPFLLEKIILRTQAAPERLQNYSGAVPVGGAAWGFYRDIDNYNFFVYHQRRFSTKKDTVQDVSSSIRSIVTNASLCFFNAPSLSTVGYEVLHNPEFKADFNMGNAVLGVGVKNSDIDISMPVKNYPRYFGGVSNVGLINQAGERASGFFQNYWPGGRTILDTRVSSSNYTGVDTFRYYFNGYYPISQKSDIDFPIDSTDRSYLTRTPNCDSTGRSSAKVDFLVMPASPAGPFLTSVQQFSYAADPETSYSPYLLFPEDELVFGFDVGVPFNRRYVTSTANFDGLDYANGLGITGSHLVLSASSDAKVILVGSLLRDSRQKLPKSLTFSSGPVSSVFEDTSRDHDEFDIEPAEILSGSIFTAVMSGRMTTTTNRSISATVGVTPGRKMLCRSQILLSQDLVYFDSLRIPPSSYRSYFRRDRFGQLRDRLEQGLDSKFYARPGTGGGSGVLNPVFISSSADYLHYVTSSVAYLDAIPTSRATSFSRFTIDPDFSPFSRFFGP